MKKFVEVHIPSNEEPPRYVVDTATGAIPIVEHNPVEHGTYERRVDIVTRAILGKVIGVDRGLSTGSDERIAYRTKPVASDSTLHEDYTWSE